MKQSTYIFINLIQFSIWRLNGDDENFVFCMLVIVLVLQTQKKWTLQLTIGAQQTSKLSHSPIVTPLGGLEPWCRRWLWWCLWNLPSLHNEDLRNFSKLEGSVQNALVLKVVMRGWDTQVRVSVTQGVLIWVAADRLINQLANVTDLSMTTNLPKCPVQAREYWWVIASPFLAFFLLLLLLQWRRLSLWCCCSEQWSTGKNVSLEPMSNDPQHWEAQSGDLTTAGNSSSSSSNSR